MKKECENDKEVFSNKMEEKFSDFVASLNQLKNDRPKSLKNEDGIVFANACLMYNLSNLAASIIASIIPEDSVIRGTTLLMANISSLLMQYNANKEEKKCLQ